MDQLCINSRLYNLQRWPVTDRPLLRAWDAADEYLLNHISELSLQAPSTLIINDQFGALAVCLYDFKPVCWSDSYLSHLATRHNYKRNELDSLFTELPSTELPVGQFDLLIIKIPKSKTLLEYQLKVISSHITENTLVIAAGMSRHIHNSTLALFERFLGPTRTTLAIKKSRLIFPEFEPKANEKTSPSLHTFYQPELKITLLNHANVFSHDQLDIGSRFLIEQLPALPAAKRIVDLGCGNGVLGIMAKRFSSFSRIDFVDESYMAIASAKVNYDAEYSDKEVGFHVSDCLENTGIDSADLVLCNPPFHQQHTLTDETARRMFKQSYSLLSEGGSLSVVGNRHMNYHRPLKKVFGNCQIIASNKKFCVMSCTKK